MSRNDRNTIIILPRHLVLLLALPIGAFVFGKISTPLTSGSLETFTAHFLSVFIEAMPFLLLGTLVSGLVEAFAHPEAIARLTPRGAFPRAVAGALLGFLFPVCECGVVPVVRRLLRKGAPMSLSIAFLLAAPIMNPIVLWSTFAAFGLGPVLYGRYVVALCVAVIIGLLAARDEQAAAAAILPAHTHNHPVPRSTTGRIGHALSVAADETLEMGFYLVLGCAVASGMQTLISQSALVGIGGGNVLSVVVMQVLAFILSVCSTVDAFIALGFAGTFSAGSIVAFLTFGPMVDIKSTLMFLSAFKRRTVVALVFLPLLLTFLGGVLLNLLLP